MRCTCCARTGAGATRSIFEASLPFALRYRRVSPNGGPVRGASSPRGVALVLVALGDQIQLADIALDPSAPAQRLEVARQRIGRHFAAKALEQQIAPQPL